MKSNEKGMTLVELLSTLVLLSLVTGVIWTTVSIATQFNVSETSVLKLQQEANYIVSELQRVHRSCYTYELIITEQEVRVLNCLDENETHISIYDGILSENFQYEAKVVPNEPIKTTTDDLDISEFTISDSANTKRSVTIPISIFRYKTN